MKKQMIIIAAVAAGVLFGVALPARCEDESRAEKKGSIDRLVESCGHHIDTQAVCLFTSRRSEVGSAGGACSFDTNLSLEFNFEDAGLQDGGMLVATAETRQGPGITARRLGDLFGAQNIEARNFTQISELWYMRTLPAGSYYKFGLMDSSSEFQALNNSGEFVNSAFGLIPNVAAPTFPDYTYAAIINMALNDKLYIRTGVADSSPVDNTSRSESAFDSTFQAVEVGYTPHPPEEEDEPATTYRFGAFRTNGGADSFDGADHPRNHGWYAAIDYSINSNINTFLQISGAPEDRNALSKYAGAGVVFSNINKKRPFDTAGLAYGTGVQNSYLREAGAGRGESVLEFFYKIQLSETFSIMPDFQYIKSPGGLGRSNFLYGLKSNYVY